MSVIFEKKLTASEIARHWIIIYSNVRNCFPPFNVNFKIRVHGKPYQTYIDSYSRLRLGSLLFNELDLDFKGDVASIKKDVDGTFLIKKKPQP